MSASSVMSDEKKTIADQERELKEYYDYPYNKLKDNADKLPIVKEPCGEWPNDLLMVEAAGDMIGVDWKSLTKEQRKEKCEQHCDYYIWRTGPSTWHIRDTMDISVYKIQKYTEGPEITVNSLTSLCEIFKNLWQIRRKSADKQDYLYTYL